MLLQQALAVNEKISIFTWYVYSFTLSHHYIYTAVCDSIIASQF